MLQLGEEPLDQIALAIKALAEAGLPFPIGFEIIVSAASKAASRANSTQLSTRKGYPSGSG